MGTRKTRVTLHGLPRYIFEDHVDFFFSKSGEVTVKSKADIDTDDVEIMLTVDRKNFMEIPDILTSEAVTFMCLLKVDVLSVGSEGPLGIFRRRDMGRGHNLILNQALARKLLKLGQAQNLQKIDGSCKKEREPTTHPQQQDVPKETKKPTAKKHREMSSN